MDKLVYFSLLALVVIWYQLAPTISEHGRAVLRWSFFTVLAVLLVTATAARVADIALRSGATTTSSGFHGRLPRILLHLTLGLVAIWLLYLFVQLLPVESQ